MLSVSFMGGGEESEKEEKKVTVGINDTINIFSLASGHLYERFLRYLITCSEVILLILLSLLG